MDRAYFAGGCFWCLEAAFKLFPGVKSVTSGYAGGTTENPTYEQVSGGMTGHAETVEIVFDPQEAGYESLLDLFFEVHDPTQENRQGADIGTQYRSAIFYTDTKQRKIIEKYLKNARETGRLGEIATEVKKLDRFWPAEQYHQDYFSKHPEAAYCQHVVRPKIEKTKLFLGGHYGEKDK